MRKVYITADEIHPNSSWSSFHTNAPNPYKHLSDQVNLCTNCIGPWLTPGMAEKNRQLVCFSSWFAWQLEKKQFSRRNESRSKKVAAMLRTEYEPTTRIRSSSSWQVVLSSETSRSGPSHWQTLIYHATPTFQWKPRSNRRRRLFPGVFFRQEALGYSARALGLPHQNPWLETWVPQGWDFLQSNSFFPGRAGINMKLFRLANHQFATDPRTWIVLCGLNHFIPFSEKIHAVHSTFHLT